MTVPTPLDAPIDSRYFEDYRVGATHEFGPIAVEAEELVSCARRFDPQPMHVDAESAARGPFGGLIASGWHTLGLMMRLLVEHYISAVAGLPSPGVDEVRWLRPVRPAVRLERVGDVVHCYGHGGAGITLSWGVADEVVALVERRTVSATTGR